MKPLVFNESLEIVVDGFGRDVVVLVKIVQQCRL